MSEVIIDMQDLYGHGQQAKVAMLPEYITKARSQAGAGNIIVLTGAGPVWLYLAVAHALHGSAKKLIYRSPVTGDLVIFDHDPF